jgi:P-type Ca2+ transporter type 2C
MGLATIGILEWADHEYSTEVARTMGMTSFAIANLFYSFCERDERESVFSLDVLLDGKFLMFSALSVIAIVLAPQVNLFNRILHTTPLRFQQWLICIVVALAVVVATEIRKFVLRRRETANPQSPSPAPGTRSRRRASGSPTARAAGTPGVSEPSHPVGTMPRQRL